MGEIIKGTCPNCGYQKDLHVGAGLASINVSMIERFFPAQIIDEFKEQKDKGQVTNYLLEHVAAECENCKELLTVPFFHYELTDGTKMKFITSCGKCKTPVRVLSDPEISCPKCQCAMNFMPGGLWD